MKICIMQPTCLPYQGFFRLMKESDIFVFLDNVQFSKQSWQQRCLVKINDKDKFLTIPAKQDITQLLKDVEIADMIKVNKLRRTIKQNFNIDLPDPKPKLVDTTVSWIKFLCVELKIFPKYTFASALGTKDIVEICKMLKCTEYISTGGSKKYFTPELYQKFKDIGARVNFMHFAPDFSICQYLHNEQYLREKELI